MSEIKIIDKAIPAMDPEEKIAIVNARLAQDEEGDRFNSILGLRLAEISEEGKQAFIDVSKSCYDKFKKLINDDELFDATTKFTGRA